MRSSAALLIFVPAVGRTEIVGRPFELGRYSVVAWHVGPAFWVLDHLFTARGLLARRCRRLQQYLFDGLKNRVTQEKDNDPEKKSNQHSNYQDVRNGTSSATPAFPAASSAMVWSSNGCLRSGAISTRGASTKARSGSLGCGIVNRSSPMIRSA